LHFRTYETGEVGSKYLLFYPESLRLFRMT
jgi:hypothetical protein